MRAPGVRAGVLAAAGPALLYVVVVAGASRSLGHLADQARADWYFLAAIVGGFGVQVALLAELRRRRRMQPATLAAGGTGAGASTAGMVACCAHHLADLVPFIGATGLAAFLTGYRVPFMLVGIGVNALGVTIAARRLHQVTKAHPRGGGRMRARLIAGALAAVVLAGGAALLLRQADDRPAATTARAAGLALDTRTVTAGAVQVRIEPRRLDADGAVFRVTLDTHSVDLGADLARAARLDVGGTRWAGPSWLGGGGSSHHREGELRFQPAGPLRGTAQLTIDGLPGPVVARWQLQGDRP
jgi:hypothetical protein